LTAPDDRSAGPDPRIDDRVLELLTARAGRLAFNGLRRTLGSHPESLARALRRLERDGFIEHAAGGYALRPEIDHAGPSRGSGAGLPTREVASVALPPGVTADDAAGALAGRWFGRLRWVGTYDDLPEPRLVWTVTDDGSNVYLALSSAGLRILIDEVPASGRADRERAASELLLQAVTRLHRAGRREDAVARLERSPASFALWADN